MKDLISIIVPVYKVEKYLENCILSLLNQTYENIEIILIDDGSPDNSGKICDEYAEKDERIKVIHGENAGVSVARNIGIENASGQYLAFIDSDDYVEKTMIERLYTLIKNNEAAISACNVIKFIEGEELKTNENLEEKTKFCSVEDAIVLTILDDNFGNFVCNKLFKKELFKEIRFPTDRRYEDVATTYKLLCKADKIAVTTFEGYYYLTKRAGSTTTTNYDSEIVLDNLKSYTEKYEYLVNKCEGIKDYLDAEYIRAVTSVLEKIYSFKIETLYNDVFVEKSMKKAIELLDSVDKNILFEVMNYYRISNISLMAYNFEFYKKIMPELYNSKK